MSVKDLIRRYAYVSPWLYDCQQFYRSRARSVLTRSVHDPDFLFFKRWAEKHAVFLDVGANSGQSISSIRSVAPNSVIHSFEPNPECYKQIKILSRLMPHIQAYNCALGSAPGKFVLNIPRAKGFTFTQLASLKPLDKDELVAELHDLRGFTFVSHSNLLIETCEVAVRTLDSFGFTPDVIKIDVEGAELDVLEGARRTLEESRPVLLIEQGSRPAIIDFLHRFGYRPFGYDFNSDELSSPFGGGVNTYFLPDGYESLFATLVSHPERARTIH